MTAVERLDEIEARAKSGAAEVVRLCSIGQRVRMSIPANVARDTDLLLMAITDEDVPALVAALRAVLAVHSPLITDRGWVCAECAQCLDDATPECPTVRAITAALDLS